MEVVTFESKTSQSAFRDIIYIYILYIYNMDQNRSMEMYKFASKVLVW